MLILILGAGDLSSGIAYRLKRAGHDIIMTEISMPTCVRRTVSYAEAVYEGSYTIENVSAVLCRDDSQIVKVLQNGDIAIVTGYQFEDFKDSLQPDILIDARMAKVNLGITCDLAPFVIGIGPGFSAGVDCHAVIETKRGHTLGRVIYNGCALPNTGIPGNVGGYTIERLIKSPIDGIFHPLLSIGDSVQAGEKVGFVTASDGTCADVYSNLTGCLRGLLHDNVPVSVGMKSGDVDARCEREYCFGISDKALSVAGGALEAVCAYIAATNR